MFHTPAVTDLRSRVDRNGRILLPAEARRTLGLASGDSVVLEPLAEGGFSLKSVAQVVLEVQRAVREAGPPTRNVVNDFLSERRAEARRDFE